MLILYLHNSLLPLIDKPKRMLIKRPDLRADAQLIHLGLGFLQLHAQLVIAALVLFQQESVAFVLVLVPVTRPVVHYEVKEVLNPCG